LGSNLLPPEITTERTVRAKKPWAVASVGALMLAFAFNFIFNYSVWSKVQPERKSGKTTWKDAESGVQSTKNTSARYTRQHKKKAQSLAFLKQVGEEVVGAGDRRLLWLELLKTIDQALPWTPDRTPQVYYEFKELPFDKRQEMYIDYVESQHFGDLAKWYKDSKVANRYLELQLHLQEFNLVEAPPEVEEEDPTDKKDDSGGLEEKPGWVIEIGGYHYYNSTPGHVGPDHVLRTLLNNLENGSVELPIDENGTMGSFTMKEMGISYPILSDDSGQPKLAKVDNPDHRSDEATSLENPLLFDVPKYDFKIQFCWQPKLLTERLNPPSEEEEEDAEDQ
jgi:type IV pilus assembly protein PilM